MKEILPIFAAVVMALPAYAQTYGQTQGQTEDQTLAQSADSPLENLFEDFRKQLEEFSDEVGPMMEGFTKEVSPLLEGLADQLKDLNAYHAPEILPNGDILIRRKSPKEQEPRSAPNSDEPGTDEVIDI